MVVEQWDYTLVAGVVVAMIVGGTAVWGFLRSRQRRRERHHPLMNAVKAVVTAMAYVVVPFDFIPEVPFGPFGMVDDAAVVGLAGIVAITSILRWLFGRGGRA